jgi:hypothetical protein
VFNVAATPSSGRMLPATITAAAACRAVATGQNLICGEKKIAVTRGETESDALRAVWLAIRPVGRSSMARSAQVCPHATTSISLPHLWQAAVANCLITERTVDGAIVILREDLEDDARFLTLADYPR